MLRRNSSKNQQRRPLSRSKSTNSILQRRRYSFETIDSVAAERDARIAATLSFSRALGVHGRRPSHPSEPEGCLHIADRQRGLQQGCWMARTESVVSRENNAIDTDTAKLKRRQSIRFAGPNANPRRVLGPRASAHNMGASKTRSEGTPPCPRSPNGFMNHASSLGPAIDPYSMTGRYLRSLEPPDEYYTPEDDVASVPSSYRKLRKSRSMFTSSNEHSGDYSFNGTAIDRLRPQAWPSSSRFASLNKEKDAESMNDYRKELQTPKSMDRLWSRRNKTASAASSRAANDIAVQLAEDKLRDQLVQQQQQLKSQPSLFFRSRAKRSDDSSMGLRKSLRNSSFNSTGLSSAFSSNSLAANRYGSLRNKARKVSTTLKSKFKGLFSRTDNLAVPPHAGENCPDNGSDQGSCIRRSASPIHEEASMLRVVSRVPSLHAVPSFPQMRSCQGSVESLNGEEQQSPDEKSRVTSWTDSVTNTIPNCTATPDWERQRLSVIKENGMHVSSSSLARSPYYHGSSASDVRSMPGPVDSQRVYSALMKRLRESNLIERSTTADCQMSSPKPRASEHESIPLNPPSIREWSPPTIRCVQPEDDVFQDKSLPIAHELNQGLQRSATNSPGALTMPGSPGPWADLEQRAFTQQRKLLPSLNSTHSVGSRTESGQKFVTERSSAFFASPTSHLFRTASPFRRALQENMRQSQDTRESEESYLVSLSNLSLPTHKASVTETPNHNADLDSESVYSNDLKNSKLSETISRLSLVERFPKPSTSHGHGNATIYVASSPPQRESSTASSVDWKTWLSANVSKWEGSTAVGHSSSTSRGDQVPAKTGHVRENAEIESPGDDSRPKPPLEALDLINTPLKPLHYNSRSNSAQKALQKAGAQQDLSGTENRAPEHIGTPSTPPIPSRSRLRTVPFLASVELKASRSDVNKPSTLPPLCSLKSLEKSSPSLREERTRKRRAQIQFLRGSESSTHSSPGVVPAPETQPQKARSVSSSLELRNSFVMREASPSQESGDMRGRDSCSQSMNSKRMVDLFLSSRRRRVHGSQSGTGSSSSPAAFL